MIDNSGSMNASKIEVARKALAVTLLSIDDFNQYLKSNAEQLNQKVETVNDEIQTDRLILEKWASSITTKPNESYLA